MPSRLSLTISLGLWGRGSWVVAQWVDVFYHGVFVTFDEVYVLKRPVALYFGRRAGSTVSRLRWIAMNDTTVLYFNINMR